MAALRYAARKLLLQRTQLISPAVDCRLVSRLIGTSPPASSPVPVSQSSVAPKVIRQASSPAFLAPPKGDEATPNGHQAKILKFQKDLQNKKQELYDLLAKVEENKYYMRDGGYIIRRFQNVKLLQNLSVDVTPKPFDPKGDFYRKTRKFNVWGVYVASAIITHWLLNVFGKKQEEDPKGEKIVCGQV